MANKPKETAVKEEDKYILSVDEMLAADDIEYATIPTWKVKHPQTGETVQGYTRIASLSAEQVQKWRDTGDGPAKKTLGLRLFVDSLVDEKGNRIGTQQHYASFSRKSNAIQEKVLAEVLRLNGMTVKGQETIKND